MSACDTVCCTAKVGLAGCNIANSLTSRAGAHPSICWEILVRSEKRHRQAFLPVFCIQVSNGDACIGVSISLIKWTRAGTSLKGTGTLVHHNYICRSRPSLVTLMSAVSSIKRPPQLNCCRFNCVFTLSSAATISEGVSRLRRQRVSVSS